MSEEQPIKLGDALKQELAHDHQLKHVEAIHDASAPSLPSTGKLLSEISSEHHLKHVETVHDASAPIIDTSVHVGKNVHGQLFSEIKGGTNFASFVI
jgi:hypothetical protein